MMEVCEKAPEKGFGWKRVWSVTAKKRSKEIEEALTKLVDKILNPEWDWVPIMDLVWKNGLLKENMRRLKKKFPNIYRFAHATGRVPYIEKDPAKPEGIKPKGGDGHSTSWCTFIFDAGDTILAEYYFVTAERGKTEIGHRLEVWKKEEGD